jgi:hypothetical protein
MPRPHRPTVEGSRQKQESQKERKVRLILEAGERQTYWDGLSTAGKLKALLGRPGDSKKQRVRLEAQLAKEAPAPKQAPKTAAPAVVAPEPEGTANNGTAKTKKKK